MFPNLESIPLPFCSAKSLCLSIPSSMNTFSTKFFQQSQPFLDFFLTLDLRTALAWFPIYSSVILFQSLVEFFFLYTFLTLLIVPVSTHLPPKLTYLPTMFWKLQLRLLLRIQISTQTPQTPLFLTLVFTLSPIFAILLRCYRHSPSNWSQQSEHDLESSLSQAQSPGYHQVLSVLLFM